MKRILILLILSTSVFSQAIITENKPLNTFINSSNVLMNFNQQGPYMEAFVKNIPWNGSYWPNRTSSIAFRPRGWKSLKYLTSMMKGVRRNLKKLRRQLKRTQSNFRKLSERDISKLSAAEKYDLLLEDSQFSFTKNVLRRIEATHYNNHGTNSWTGICHGWSPAAIKYQQPTQEKVFVNSFGHRIVFTPQDLKALVSYFVAWSSSSKKPIFLGNRCNKEQPQKTKGTHQVLDLKKFSRSPKECSDITPLEFHSILINKVGIQKESFIVDIDYNAPVNNHPIAGYKMKVTSTEGNKVSLHAEVFYADLIKPYKKKAHEDVHEYKTKNYYYTLTLDAKGNIIDSMWLNKSDAVWAPDFLWYYPKDNSFHEYYTSFSKGLNFDMRSAISQELKTAALKSSTNRLRLSYLTRLYSNRSKNAGIYKKALKYSRDKNISLAETESIFTAQLDAKNVKAERANPQILKTIIETLVTPFK